MGKKVKIGLLIFVVLIFGAISCFLLNKIGLDDLGTIKSLLNDNIYGAIFYVILLGLQVVFVPINSLVIIVPAIMAFGAFKCFLLSVVALMIGSCIAYYIGKIFGTSVIRFFAGAKNAEKWQNLLLKNGKFALPLLLIIPIFPDELICMLAGIARLKFGYFFTVSLLTRIVDLSCICFIGAILPMHGWWLVLWIALITLSTLLAVYLSKHQDKIQNKIVQYIGKLKHKQINKK